MTRAENARLQALERRLRSAYTNAARVMVQRNNRAIARLAAVEIDPDLTGLARRNAVRAALFRVEAADDLLQNIAHELSMTRTTADRMIRGESLNLFEGAYRRQFNEIRGQVRGLGIRADFSMIDRNSLNAVFNGEYTQLGQLEGYQSAFTQVGHRQVFEFDEEQPWEQYKIERRGDGAVLTRDRARGRWFYDRSMARLGDTPTLVTRLQNELAEALILGEGIPKITRRIQAVGDMSFRQARRIAQTETIRALNQGRYLAATQAETEHNLPMLKIWHAAHDERTREDHADASGQKVPKGEPFTVGGEPLEYPVDPNGSPENIINCRCSHSYRVDVEALKKAG